MSVTVDLTPEELLRLAVLDIREKRHDEAIVKLKRCLARTPNHAQAYHLLAAEHAEIGMFREAEQEFAQAITLDPSSIAARFQLGLLYAVTNRPLEAQHAWGPIKDLEPDGPWDKFRSALECVLNSDPAAAIRNLDAGLAKPFSNDALRKDMLGLRERLKNAAGADGSGMGGELLLKSYQGSNGESDA